ncbi:mannose-1-phosphate guanylyltransferase/mannose-6-phosphate isomerase [uncultured Thioclava sp.]|uniref:mannose-1-phosphate guanylyltransferase/mannose-6-phosphate isomerase n=1 Tax=uncultured Thioclava sp. TaxID=473858 RepID=UPI0025F7C290|nr:mannose-1-phosphate guanylyltransferase/mannose-6-phosphate isomerase [uncultured Thioclava sp.]
MANGIEMTHAEARGRVQDTPASAAETRRDSRPGSEPRRPKGAATITPALLCGGSGTRLWPLSRKSYPKQFAPLMDDQTLFQAAARRMSGAGFHAPIILTHTDFRFIVTEQLAAAGITPSAVLIEPLARNTAPSVLAAAVHLERTSPDGLLLIAPSDHVVTDSTRFLAAIEAGRSAAMAGKIVTFGVSPTRPETGYGYIEPAPSSDPETDSQQPRDIVRFIEKPDAAHAADMLAQGGYLWNTGIVLASARTIIAAFAEHAPDLLDPVTSAVESARPDLDFIRLDSASWAEATEISFDYAIMERARNLAVVTLDTDWSDLGDWAAVLRASNPDARGVALSGAATAIDCDMSLLRSEDEGLQLVGLGLHGVIAVAMPDAVLVADASRAQEVKEVVAKLRAQKAKQATEFPKDHRPWGWFESLATGSRFQVKRIVVHPGAALSLQSHHHRSEHWIVVAGTARVTVNDKVSLISENESVYIPLGATHRMENPGKFPMVLIEVQTGAYLGEDDIVRYEDVYARK